MRRVVEIKQVGEIQAVKDTIEVPRKEALLKMVEGLATLDEADALKIQLLTWKEQVEGALGRLNRKLGDTHRSYQDSGDRRIIDARTAFKHMYRELNLTLGALRARRKIIAVTHERDRNAAVKERRAANAQRRMLMSILWSIAVGARDEDSEQVTSGLARLDEFSADWDEPWYNQHANKGASRSR